MEITYNVGATVILQGPATYEVESKDGGYLSRGKLTAKVEKKDTGGGRGAYKSEIRNCSPSELPPPPSPTWAPSLALRWRLRVAVLHVSSRARLNCGFHPMVAQPNGPIDQG